MRNGRNKMAFLKHFGVVVPCMRADHAGLERGSRGWIERKGRGRRVIRKTVRHFRRRSFTWNNHRLFPERHVETVLRETWWLFGVMPLYSRDEIVGTDINSR